MVLTPLKITQQDRINRLNTRRQANELAGNPAVPPVAPVVPPVGPVAPTTPPKPNNILSVTDRGGMDAPIEQRNPYASTTPEIANIPTPGKSMDGRNVVTKDGSAYIPYSQRGNQVATTTGTTGTEGTTGTGGTTGTNTQGYINDITTVTENEIKREEQKYLQDLQRAGTVGLDRPTEDLTTQKDLQLKALERSLEQTKFSINNQISDVAREAQKTVDMGTKAGALKGFKGSGYTQGIQNIRDDADRTISRLQQSLAFAEQYTGEDKGKVMDAFNKEMARAKEDFAYQMREVMNLASIETQSLVSKYGYSPEKLSTKLDSITLDVLQKREDLIGKYIQNSRSTIAMANDQLAVMENYDNWINQGRDRYNAIITADNGSALSTMTFSDMDKAVSQGYLSPEQALGYKQLMIGKSVSTLQGLGMPTKEDVDQLAKMIQGGISPSAAISSIVNANKSRYTPVQEPQKRDQVSGMAGQFYTTNPDGSIKFAQAPGVSVGSSDYGYAGPSVQAVAQNTMTTTLQNYTSIADGTTVRNGQCGEFVNDYLKDMGVAMKFVDPIDVRATQTNSQSPTVGSVVVMRSNSSDLAKKYGHVAIVTAVNQDGTISVKEQNGKTPLKVGQRTISTTDGNIVGYFDPTKGIQQLSQGVQQNLSLSKEAQSILNLVNKGGSIDDLIKGTSKDAQKLRNEVIMGLDAQGGETQKNVEMIQEAYLIARQMQDKKDYKEFGLSSMIGGTSLPSYGDMKMRADQISAILTKDNLGLMKGVLSESDLLMLKQMSGGLDTGGTISEGAAKEKIDSMVTKISKRLESFGIDPKSLENTGTVQTTQTNQKNTTQTETKKNADKFLKSLGL